MSDSPMPTVSGSNPKPDAPIPDGTGVAGATEAGRGAASVASAPVKVNSVQQIPKLPATAPPKKEKPRPHVCRTCNRSFVRLEHLTRHERSHTKEKPYQCPICGRCFARRDLLLRHSQKLHPTTVASSQPRNGASGQWPRYRPLKSKDSQPEPGLGAAALADIADENQSQRTTQRAPAVLKKMVVDTPEETSQESLQKNPQERLGKTLKTPKDTTDVVPEEVAKEATEEATDEAAEKLKKYTTEITPKETPQEAPPK